MWIFGGDGGQRVGRYSDLYALNLCTLKWTNIPLGWCMCGCGTVCSGILEPINIYNMIDVNLNVCLNLFAWSAGVSPCARVNHSACILDRTMAVYGGWDWEQSFDDLFIFDFGTRSSSKSAIIYN